MKKRICLYIAGVCIFLTFVASLILSKYSCLQNEMEGRLNRVENALGEEWKKQTVTKVTDLVYSDNERNTINYYVCVTTYYGVDATEKTGLNTDAIAAVISPEKAESWRECTVSNLPAVICQKDGRAYLCWTVMPELSCVIEYDPSTESEEDIFRMAESVPANQSQTDKP